MNPRERVLSALRHEPSDRVPYYLGFTQPARRKFEEYCGTSDLDSAIGNHIAVYSSRRNAPWEEIRPGFWRDAFGVVWNRNMDPDIGVVEECPLQERTLGDYEFPDPRDPRRYARIQEFVAAHPARFRLVNHGFTLFERAWTLRGMEQLLVDMLDDPEGVDELLDGIVEFTLGMVEELARHDIDGIMFADDWAYQQGLIMGPGLWRRFIKPRIERLFRAARSSGLKVFLHCCGKVQELFGELVEMELDAFNPFQPEVMDPAEMKRLFGDRITFFGGMSVQRVLPRGTPDDVRAEARRLLEVVGAGGGYIIAPSHDLPGDVPVENIAALLEVIRGD